MNWRGGLTIILLLAVIASGWSVWTHSEDAPDSNVVKRPDYVLRDYEIVSLDSEGKEAFTLRGPELQRDLGAKSMTLLTPLFLVPDRNGAYWEIRAKHGFVPEDGKELRLRGEVVATSPVQAPPPTRIETSELNLFPRANRATSSVAVTITRPGLTMRGRGLEADFNRQQATLLSDVTARYVPSPH
ncbi:LPS export ABC transporter periplasmic protein LptC [Thermomonas sp.]|uniref:LPS export ABC transporter periplasmic protein LptC n=1 Tax=Thermomonas sp. TaxID=1971895 RepID=UPI00248A4774|nr:LPS export ABC transporter periplasmic protein LptC [Thermomonas sp.]MDI1251895.1 LPS export ABC transporter periplasmic protein LptC [Thermomonas sp.]